MMPGLVGYSAVEFVVVFNPETPDRTAAIASGGESPVPYLRDSALLLQQMGASHVVYPCNTAHYFLPHLLRTDSGHPPVRVPIVDMIDAAVEAAATARLTRIGLLATTGTIESGLYQDALRNARIEVLLPTPREQDDLVMETVYGAHGVKAGHTTGLVSQLAYEAARRLAARGAEGIILGCTELPLVMKGARLQQTDERWGRSIVLIDPADAVSRRLKAIGGSHGIAGGLGPEATVAFLEMMDAPTDFVELQRDIVRATRDELGATCDQEHLKMLCIASRDPVDAARRLARAGAEFLVMAASAAAAREEAEAAAHVPALAARAGQRLGKEVVLRAARITRLAHRNVAAMPLAHARPMNTIGE
jgi:aspartate racemase